MVCKSIIPAEISENSTPIFSNNQQTDTIKSVMNKELNYIIECSLQQIPIDYRMVFTLREINGLNVNETADILNISESNVKTRLNRAKAIVLLGILTIFAAAIMPNNN
ncbi:MAG: hypothetical protein B7Y11_12650 [Sphingobacteriia bacterium 24-36-13]|jgi:RNA polymerase sigma-70 factor (ECF subfamily)|nr:MAG: hypothetical protein B7Y66_05420 [Sphingobacteriia bacterium 35-36-14]OYZ52104.1 MAG: hypothetical protein B7Y11_12650 [Sphingobacteriia bacterium 24-36-13]OZA63264.1 MAG: hypothetical protein B7X68_11185 [Sphingobacteriia bacterium 39-36-14]